MYTQLDKITQGNLNRHSDVSRSGTKNISVSSKGDVITELDAQLSTFKNQIIIQLNKLIMSQGQAQTNVVQTMREVQEMQVLYEVYRGSDH